MLTCSEATPLIARADHAAPGDVEQRGLDAHIAACASCRAALEDQREVARILHTRAQFPVPPGFEARLAARIDHEHGGWLTLADWRAWTVGLAPVAAALVLLAWLSPGLSTARIDDGRLATGSAIADSAGTPVTFEAWIGSQAGSTPAAVFMEPGAGADALLEAVLTGGAASTGEARDVR